ncbi:hypothetical protein SSTU70S_00349 [Stutzerimonas stutzeri]
MAAYNTKEALEWGTTGAGLRATLGTAASAGHRTGSDHRRRPLYPHSGARRLGNCDKAPALMIDDDTFGDVRSEGVAALLEAYP